MPKSPFPGMDPYLEQSWRDVHHKLCTYACDDIQSLIDRVYRNGAYDVEIDYRQACRPPLEGEDEEWAAKLLKDAGLR